MTKPLTNWFGLIAAVAGFCVPAFAGTPVQSAAPEPSTILLVAGAGGALLVIRQLRRKK